MASPRSWFLALAALRATLLESRCSIPAATCRATQCALVPAVSPALSQCGPCSGCDAFAAFGERRAKTVPPFRRARHVADDCALRLSTDVTSHDCRHRFVHGRTKPMPRARLPAASLVQSTQRSRRLQRATTTARRGGRAHQATCVHEHGPQACRVVVQTREFPWTRVTGLGAD